MLIQCTPLLVEKAGVAPDVTLRFTACKQVSVQVREPCGLKTHGEDYTKSKIGAINGPTKWTLVQQKKVMWIYRRVTEDNSGVCDLVRDEKCPVNFHATGMSNLLLLAITLFPNLA